MAIKHKNDKLKKAQAVVAQVEKTSPPPKVLFREFIKDEIIQQKFIELNGTKGPTFLLYVADIVEADKRLVVADNDSIVNAAAQSLNLGLSLDPNLGLAYITAYKDRTRGNKIMAQFSIGWKGYVELCHRSGLFHKINVELVHTGEFGSIDRMTGDMTWNWNQNNDEREKLQVDGVVAYFKLLNGFEKSFWMTVGQLEAHAMKYSDEYRLTQTGPWKDNKPSMYKKTTVKLLLDKWAPKSVETKTMQLAIRMDQAVVNDLEGNNIHYPDNTGGRQSLDEFNAIQDRQRTIDFIAGATSVEALEKCYSSVPDLEVADLYIKKRNELLNKK